MSVTMMKIARKVCAASLFLMAAALVSAQQQSFDGSWQMDTANSHVRDGRVVTITIATANNAIKMVMKTRTGDGREETADINTKFNGKSCDVGDGQHKFQVTMWFNGPTLNACKENGPPDDVTSVWKFELSPDKQTMTMTVTHYEPAADPETLVFTKKTS